MIRVLLADDQDLVREGLRMLLDVDDIEVVGEAQTASRRWPRPVESTPTSC